jgi:uncharacterized protein
MHLNSRSAPPQPDADSDPMFSGYVVPRENPPWTGWDVLRIFLFAVAMLFGFLIATTLVAKAAFFPSLKFFNVMSLPLVATVAQVLAYFALFVLMFSVATRQANMPFRDAIRWNWPTQGVSWLLLTGLITYLGVLGVAAFLPLPKKTPFEEFLKRPSDAYALALLAITLGPLMEELFFRGFLYAVLARRLGIFQAVFLTAIPFALIHYSEYAAWGPVLLVFLAGLVFTIVRVRHNSVAASFLVHAVYNGAQMVILFVHTSGFRHLEKLSR